MTTGIRKGIERETARLGKRGSGGAWNPERN